MLRVFITFLILTFIALASFYYYLESAGPLPAESFITKEDLLSPTNIKLYNVKLNKFSSINQNGEISENEVEHTFSFIIPVHNTAQYLKEAVESIISQQIESYEIIMVENNSTDNSLETCKELAQQNSAIKVITQTNGGAGGARNTGLLHARGKYIFYLDSDDFYQPDVLNESEILKLKEYDVIVFGYNKIRAEDGSFIKYRSPNLQNLTAFNSDKYHNGSFSSFNFCYDAYTEGFNKIFKRTFLIENKIFFPNQVRYEDYYTALAVATKKFKGFVVDIPLYNYRVGRITSLTNSEIKMFEIFYILERFRLYLQEEGIYSKFGKALWLHEYRELFRRLHQIPLRDAYRWLKFLNARYQAMPFELEENESQKIKRVQNHSPFFVIMVHVIPRKVEVAFRKIVGKDVFN